MRLALKMGALCASTAIVLVICEFAVRPFTPLEIVGPSPVRGRRSPAG